MWSSSTLGALLGTVLIITSIPDAASYTKYGRTCKDIGCRRDEVCVMAEDPCSIYQRDNCGRYPTCTKAHPGGANCVSMVCGENEYCKTENDMPTCVKKSTAIDDEMFAEFDGDNRIFARRQSEVKPSNTEAQSGYPSGSGYPSTDSKSTYPTSESQPKSSYPSSSGYPSRTSSSGYPSSGYPSSSGYPAGGSSGYPSSSYPSGSSGYPASSGYPSGSSSGYPSSSSGYPAGTGYPSRSGYPASSSGYPSSSYPSSSSRGYPPSSGYPSSTNEESVKRVDASSVNAGYPSQRANYPTQNSGYPAQANPYGNYPGYNQGYPQGGYPQGYPQGYQPQGYPGGYQGYYPPPPPPPTTKKPNIGDQLTSLAKDLAGRLITQAILDKVSGKH